MLEYPRKLDGICNATLGKTLGLNLWRHFRGLDIKAIFTLVVEQLNFGRPVPPTMYCGTSLAAPKKRTLGPRYDQSRYWKRFVRPFAKVPA